MPFDADAAPRTTLREGLPPAFRMRADAHYVEQLDALTPAVTVQYIAVHAIDVSDGRAIEAPRSLVESIKRHGVLEPLIVQRNNGTYKTISGQKRLAAARAAGVRDVPCLVHHVGDDKARVLQEALSEQRPLSTETSQDGLIESCDAQLAHALAALTSSAKLLTPPIPVLTRGVAADVIQAELWRARCLFHNLRMVRHGASPIARRVFPRELLHRVLDSAEPERRLRSLTIDTSIDVADARTLHADQDLLVFAFGSLLLAAAGLIDGVPGARILVTATALDSRLVVGISQDMVPMDEMAPDGLALAPGQTRHAEAALALRSLRKVIEAHRGRVSMLRMGAGTRVLVDLPLEPPQA